MSRYDYRIYACLKSKLLKICQENKRSQWIAAQGIEGAIYFVLFIISIPNNDRESQNLKYYPHCQLFHFLQLFYDYEEMIKIFILMFSTEGNFLAWVLNPQNIILFL